MATQCDVIHEFQCFKSRNWKAHLQQTNKTDVIAEAKVQSNQDFWAKTITYNKHRKPFELIGTKNYLMSNPAPQARP